jgi:hypothetical protein
MHVLRQTHPEVDLMADLVQQFVQMLRTRTGELLDDWLAQVNRSNLPELQSFAAGVEKDKDAVRAGLTWWINKSWISSPAQTGPSCCVSIHDPMSRASVRGRFPQPS